jgi:hypothetical protein
VVLNTDGESTTFLREDRVRHERSKHIDTLYQYIKDCVKEGKMKANYVRTDDQLAYILTKTLDCEKFLKM